MIQRLQSIFLFLASGACFGLFGTDAADTPQPIASSEVFADGSFNVFDSPLMIGSFALAGLIFLVTIFLFKNRPLQMKLTWAALFITGLGVGFGIFEYSNEVAAANVATVVPDFGLALPGLIVLFSVLARNYIKKDEKLVRSADRLR